MADPQKKRQYLPCLLLLRGPKTQQKHGHHARDRQVQVQSRGCLDEKKKLATVALSFVFGN
jgi:hypothetical protein